jgi:hypothetical protein
VSALVEGRPTLGKLREGAAGCRRCHLWERAAMESFVEDLRVVARLLA